MQSRAANARLALRFLVHSVVSFGLVPVTLALPVAAHEEEDAQEDRLERDDEGEQLDVEPEVEPQ